MYSQVTRRPSQPPPENYRSTSFEYNYSNNGLPYFDGPMQHFKLQKEIVWKTSTPATLIMAMKSLTLIRVGLPNNEVDMLNSVMFEMYQAFPLYRRRHDDDLDYVTDKSLIFLTVDEETNVQVLHSGGYVVMQPPAILTRWNTCHVKAEEMKLSIQGLKRCCNQFAPIIHIDSIMVEDEDNDTLL